MRFDSMADMPAGMRDLYAKKVLGQMPQARPEPEQKRAKYQNQKAERGEIHFDSQKEARRYDELLLMLRAGEIRDLRLQPQSQRPGSGYARSGTRRTFHTSGKCPARRSWRT